MRSLGKLGIVAGLFVLFAVSVWALSSWRAGAEKSEAVVVVVDPPSAGGDVIPLRGRASLFSGPARDVKEGDTAVDDAEEVNLETAEEPRFELNADSDDGSTFFVYAWMEMSNYDIYCDSIALPRIRSVEDGDTQRWVNAETGAPLETVHVALRKKCHDPQTS